MYTYRTLQHLWLSLWIAAPAFAFGYFAVMSHAYQLAIVAIPFLIIVACVLFMLVMVRFVVTDDEIVRYVGTKSVTRKLSGIERVTWIRGSGGAYHSGARFMAATIHFNDGQHWSIFYTISGTEFLWPQLRLASQGKHNQTT